MKRSISALCAALACLSNNKVQAFAPSAVGQTVQRQQHTAAPSRQSPSKSSLYLWLPDEHALTSASSFISTIDADIANIPDNEFGKVFAGAGFIMLGSILSTVFVGFLIESTNGYADLVAETYVERELGEDGKESFLDSLKMSSDQKAETEEMVRAYREKKKKNSGNWTAEDEENKKQLAEDKELFDDYE